MQLLDKEDSSIVAGKAAAEETEDSMPGEWCCIICDLVQFQVEGGSSWEEASQNQAFSSSRLGVHLGLISKISWC